MASRDVKQLKTYDLSELGIIQKVSNLVGDIGRVAQWLATCTRKSKVPGSSPAARYVQR